MRAPAAVVAVLAVLLVGGAATAAGAEGEAPASAVLTMHVAAAESVVDALRERLEPRLGDLHVALELGVTASVDVDRVLNRAGAADAASSRPLATVWLDGRASDAALLFLIPRGAERVLARRIAVPAGFDGVALAEVTFVVERAVASLLAAQTVGIPIAEARVALAAGARARAPATAAAPATASLAPAAATSRTAFELAACVGTEAWSTERTVVPALGLSALVERVRDQLRFGLWLGGRVRRSVQIEGPEASFTVAGGSVHLMVAAGRSFGDFGVGRLALGPGLAVTSVDPQALGSATRSVRPHARTDVDLAVSAAARWDVPVFRGASAFLALALDALPVSAEYTAVVAGQGTAVLAPWPVRPAFLVGVALAGSR